MKKRIIGLIAVLFICMLCGFRSEEQKIYDDADLLTDSQEEELQQSAVSLAQKLEQDIIIVTTDDAMGKTAMEYADDFYDEHGFGYEKQNGSGVLFLIDMDNREIWISTAGTAIEKLTDSEIESMLDSMIEYMYDSDYQGVCEDFLWQTQKYVSNQVTADNGYYDTEQNVWVEEPGETGWKKVFSFDQVVKRVLICAVIAGIIVVILIFSNKSKMSVNNATYLQDGGLHMNRKLDKFTHTSVSKRHIPKDDGGGGGGSSVHTSSGGSSHGGGGRSF